MQTAQPDGIAGGSVCFGPWLHVDVDSARTRMCMWSTLDYAATSIDDGHHKGVGQQLVLCLASPPLPASTNDDGRVH